jgi:hypothetical protein
MSSVQFVNVGEYTYWCHVRVFEKQALGNIEFFEWTGLKWHLRLKYDWYFRYRAALLQVKYPRYNVVFNFGKEKAEGKTLAEIRNASISSKKGKITAFKNKLAKFEAQWAKNTIYDISLSKDYIKAKEKIKRLENELLEFISQS